MNVLVLTAFFSPDRAGIAAVSTDLVAGLVEAGYSVTVRCAFPYYPEWQDKSGKNGFSIESETLGDAKVERFGLWIPRNPKSLLGRLIQEASFFLSLMRKPRARGFDAVVAFCPLLSTVGYALALRFLSGCPVMVSVQDLPAEAASSARLAGPRLARVFALIQSRLLRRCDVVTTISPEMGVRLAPQVGSANLHVVPNWLSRDTERAIGRIARRRTRGGTTRLLYAGNLGGKQGLSDLVRKLAAAREDFEFRIFGEGSERATLAALVEELDDRRISIGPFLSLENFLQEVADADWFVIPELGGASAPFFPSKLMSVIALGCPIMAVCDKAGPLGREIERFGLGRAVGWSEIDQGLSATLADRTDYRANCIARAGYYARERALAELRALVGQMVEHSAPHSSRPADFLK